MQQQPHQLPLARLTQRLIQRLINLLTQLFTKLLIKLIAERLPGRDQRPLADLQPLAAIAHLHLPLSP